MAKCQEFYSELKIVERYARRVVFTYNGEQIGDASLIIEALLCLYAICVDYSGVPTETLRRRFGAWLVPGGQIDLESLDRDIADVDSFIINYLRLPAGTYSRRDFNRLFGHSVSPMIYIMSEELQFFLETQDVESFRKLHTFYCFLKRVHVDLPVETGEVYLAAEASMKNWQYETSITDALNQIAKQYFTGPPPIAHFRPKNGPGATYEVSRSLDNGLPKIAEKYLSFSCDRRLRYLEKDLGQLESWTPMHWLPNTLRRINRIIDVPKGLAKRRTISAEPSILQYFQQGVRNMLMHAIRTSPLSSHIDLADQGKSRDLAWLGSIDGSYATIDLSNASDSVTLSLVKKIFRGTWVYKYLICTRSDYADVKIGAVTQRVKLEKFAPMGSATCFPVECIVFSLICELARRSCKSGYYRVYGDDICVSTHICHHVVQLLEALHFEVNTSKSFANRDVNTFRESCGGEYLNGVEVTPLRFPRFYTGMYNYLCGKDPRHVASCMAFCNRANAFGAVHLRRFLLQELQSFGKMETKDGTFPFSPAQMARSTDGSFGLTVETVFGPVTYNNDYQRAEYHCFYLSTRSKAPEWFLDFFRYWEWLRSSEDRTNDYSSSIPADIEFSEPIQLTQLPTLTWKQGWFSLN